MSWYSFQPYVSVAQRRQKAALTARKMAKQGQPLSPVQPEGRAIAKSFWGLAWCKNLESYSDYANRLPRGRTYLRNGSVIDLQIAPGLITAMVMGSSLYKIRIQIESLPAARWKSFCAECAGQVSSLLDLLQGRLSKGVLEAITRPVEGLFPSTKQIKLSCSCPDSAGLCKHLAAAIYGVGTRLDEKPDLFFTLRAVDMKDLVTAATASATQSHAAQPGDGSLQGEDLSALFGIEVETSAETAPPPVLKSSEPRKLPKGAALARADRAVKAVKAIKPGRKPSASGAKILAEKAVAPKTPRPVPTPVKKKK